MDHSSADRDDFGAARSNLRQQAQKHKDEKDGCGAGCPGVGGCGGRLFDPVYGMVFYMAIGQYEPANNGV